MAYSTVPKVRRDGVIQLIDGTGVPVTLDIAYEEGNFTFDKPGGGDSPAAQTIVRDRGVITTVRKGDDEPITGSFSAFFRQFTDGSEAGSVIDFITKRAIIAATQAPAQLARHMLSTIALTSSMMPRAPTLVMMRTTAPHSQNQCAPFHLLKVTLVLSQSILHVMAA